MLFRSQDALQADLSGKELKETIDLLRKRRFDKGHLALLCLDAADAEQALELAREAAKGRDSHVYPQAILAHVLDAAGKREEALEVFDTLRERCARVDLELPAFKRLAPLAEAREEARGVQKDAQAGKDPRGHAKRNRATMEEASRNTWAALAEIFLVKYAVRKGLRSSTLRDYRRALQGPDVQDWADKPVATFTRKDIRDRLDTVSERAPIHANRLRAYWGKFFVWLVENEWIEASPVIGVARPVWGKIGRAHV